MFARYSVMLLIVWLFIGCGGESNPVTHQPTIREVAIQKISQYAQSHGSSEAPTLQDYLDAGVTGIDTQEELDKVNEAVADLTAEEVDTKEEIQVVAEELGITLNPHNTAPVADAGSDQILDAGTSASLNCSGVDSDGSIITYHWLHEGTVVSDAQQFTTDVLTEGIYHYTCEVTDNDGTKASDTLIITVNIQHDIQSTIRKTGQTISYSVNAYGDDGYYQTGVDVSYTRDENTEVVTDHLSKLMWQDDVAVEDNMARWITEDNYSRCEANQSSAACFDTSGDTTAATYCSTLRLGEHDDWRVPTVRELRSIVSYTPSAPSIASVFKHMAKNISWTARHYWSATPVSDNNLSAWPISFQDGYIRYRTKNMPHHVRCVRNQEE